MKKVTKKSEKITEAIQDGERFSRSIKKITKNKAYIEKAQRLRDSSAQRAINIGLIDPQSFVNAPDINTKERRAQQKIKASLAIQNAQDINLSQEDVEFINGLPDDDTRDIIIEELFSKRIAKQYKAIAGRDVTKIGKAAPSQRAIDFIKGYIDSYNRLLQGIEHKSLTEIREDSGYSASTPVSLIIKQPWIAHRIEMYHQSLDKLNEYHYNQIRDRKTREQIKVQDIKDFMMNHLLANPHEMVNSAMRDKTQLLRVMNEMGNEGSSNKNNAPPIAIQINGDIARLAMSQDKEKRDHFEQSF